MDVPSRLAQLCPDPCPEMGSPIFSPRIDWSTVYIQCPCCQLRTLVNSLKACITARNGYTDHIKGEWDLPGYLSHGILLPHKGSALTASI